MRSEKFDIFKEHEKAIRSLEEKVDRLQRIIKYAGDEPSARVVSKIEEIKPEEVYWSISRRTYCKTYLYLYIDKQEYSICVPEIRHLSNGDSVVKVEVVRDVAYVTLKDYSGLTVDYKKGTYIYSRIAVSNHMNSNTEKDDKKELAIWQQRCERMRDFIQLRTTHADEYIRGAYNAGIFTANDLEFLGVELPEIIDEDKEVSNENHI